jgi:poly(A) polymerase
MNLKSHIQGRLFDVISSSAHELGTRAFVIGGYVRDAVMGRECMDIDVVSEYSGVALAEKVAQSLGVKKISVFKNFGTAHFRFEGYDVEFVGARKESYRRGSRKPIVEDGTLEDDQNRRDFTINALAISLEKNHWGEVVDPFDGLKDIEAGVIRTPLDPVVTYSDDPLRMMRAIRFATQLGFEIEKESFAAIAALAERLRILSAERISDELNKIILSPTPSLGFKLLEQSGLLIQFFPEMVALKGVEKRDGMAHKDNFYHTLEVLDNVAEKSDNLWLRWAAILHDIAKPATKRFEAGHGWTFHGHEDKGSRMVPKIFARLKLPLDHQMKFVQKLVLLHLRPIVLTKEEISDSAVRRLLFEAGDDIDALMILCRADITSKNEKRVKRYLANYEVVIQKLIEVEEKDSIRNFQPPISGELIMKTFGIKPSREIGIIKNAIKEAILEGEIQNDYDQAYKYMIERAKEIGLVEVG